MSISGCLLFENQLSKLRYVVRFARMSSIVDVVFGQNSSGYFSLILLHTYSTVASKRAEV